ncbi:putative reverse transcriptase domain-containing protein, partial [Tanacetum coccineum]
PEIRGMLWATQPTTIQTAILRAGILTDEAVSCGTLTENSDKRKGVEEPTEITEAMEIKLEEELSTADFSFISTEFAPLLNVRPSIMNPGTFFMNVNVNAMEAVQDPKVVTGTFSLNDHFVTILFDSGVDFSFISTEFAPLLNVKPNIVNPGYVIEVADGKLLV